MAVTALSIPRQTQLLADYLPGGRLFQSKNLSGSNLRKLLTGIAYELFTADGYLADFQEDVIPDATIYFIAEWESALGIPDECFDGTGTLDQRRTAILVKLAALGVQTLQDFQDLADLFGVTTTIHTAVSLITFPLTFPIPMFTTLKEARFTIVVDFVVAAPATFPLTFPSAFGENAVNVLDCLFQKLRPANCNVVFRQV